MKEQLFLNFLIRVNLKAERSSPLSCSAACVHQFEPHQSDFCTAGDQCHPAILKTNSLFESKLMEMLRAGREMTALTRHPVVV